MYRRINNIYRRGDNIERRINNMQRKIFSVAALLVFGLLASTSLGATRQWRNPNDGLFQSTSNWVGGVVPGMTDIAAFGFNGSTSPFVVTFNANVTTAGLNVTNQRPTFDFAGFSYNTTNVTVGGLNTPSLTISNGTLAGGWTRIGPEGAGPGAVLVNGPDAAWLGATVVGDWFDGTLTVSGGALMDTLNSELTLGWQPGVMGTVDVTGSGSRLFTGDPTLVVGRLGVGNLTVSDGAFVRTGRIAVACDNPTTGTVTITGVGSRLESYGSDGRNGCGMGSHGTIIVEEGGAFTHGVFMHGASFPGSVGDFIVRDPGSTLTTPYLHLGDGGAATLMVSNGGVITITQSMDLTRSPTSTSVCAVSGEGSVVNITNGLYTSNGGYGSLSISGGGVLTAREIANWGVGTSVDYTVQGTGSQLSQVGNGWFSVGRDGANATLLVSDGGAVTARELYIGRGAPPTAGFVTICGSGSEVVCSEALWVGDIRAGSASLEIREGALVLARQLRIESDNAYLLIDGMESLAIADDWGVYLGTGANLLIQNGGALESNGGMGIFGSLAQPAEFVVHGAASYAYAQGRIDVGGDPASQLGGIVTLVDGGTIISADYMSLNAGGVVQGSGAVDTGLANSRGVVRPGLDIGALHVSPGGYYQGEGGTLEVEIGGLTPGSQHDVLEVVGNVWLDGTLGISLIDNFIPAIGDSFEIVTYTGQRDGMFEQILGADVAPGRALAVTYPSNGVRLVVEGVVELNIEPPSQSVYVGFTESLTLIAELTASGPVVVTASGTWSSDDTSIATVSTDGRVTGIAAGITTIRAAFAGFQASVPVTVLSLPISPGTEPGLVADYFDLDRPDFEQSTPVVTETLATIDIPCPAYGQPFGGSGLIVDYGAIFTGQLIVPTDDEYTLDFLVDWGGARLVVDGFPIAAKDWWSGPVTATVFLSAGTHDVLCELYKFGDYGGTSAILRWESDTIPSEVIPAEAWTAPGVYTRYYSITEPTLPTDVPDFTDWVVFYSAVVPDLNYPYNYPPGFMGPFGSNTGVRFSGHLTIPAAGEYTFYLHVDEGAKVFVDGELVAYSNHGWWHEASGTLNLTAGLHPLRVDAYERGYFHGLVLEMEGPGASRQPIPASAFSHGGAFFPGDLNGDGVVNLSDLAQLLAHYGMTGGATYEMGDIDGDGDVDLSDLAALLGNYGMGA